MKEEVDPRIRELAVTDPIALYSMLAEMRRQGKDPITEGILPSNPVTKKVKDVTRWVDQQVKGAEDSGDAWLEGVKNPSRDPIAAAIAAKDKYKDRLEQAIKDGKWEKNLAKSSHAEIVKVAEAVGTGAYTGGVTARKEKIARVVRELQPLVQSVSDAIQAMPDKTDANREARLIAARKLMIQVGKDRAGA